MSLSSADRLNTQSAAEGGVDSKPKKSLTTLQEGAEHSHGFKQHQISMKTSALGHARPLAKLTGQAIAPQPDRTAELKASTEQVKSQAGTQIAASEVLDSDQEQSHREIS